MSTALSIFTRGPRPPGFDIAFEILASMPPAAPVSIKLLAGDLGLSIREIRNTIVYLINSGFGVHLGEDQCWLDPAARRSVAATAESYWSRVWERRLAS